MTIYAIQPSPRAPKSQALIFSGRIPAGRGWREKEGWAWKVEPCLFDGAADLRALAEALAAYEAKHADA